MTDRETENAMPVVAHIYGVIVSKNLDLQHEGIYLTRKL